ncbi:beta-1,3-galactosyltransferase brn-like [Watersipora subatra]|uniref:beta-1,3-galactosyltransferase brn-like n=1 Tax=Watersipora subatra TaxID=2589382 RepID=UPI00355B4431
MDDDETKIKNFTVIVYKFMSAVLTRWTVRWSRKHPLIACVVVLLAFSASYAVLNRSKTVSSILAAVGNEIWATPMSQYKWPLEIEAHNVVRDYKAGRLALKPITKDNTTIILYPNKARCGGQPLLTVLVKTRVEDKFNRDLLRRTWVTDLLSNGLQYSFLIGECKEKSCQTALEAEVAEHGDLLQGGFVDSYLNNTLKFTVGLKYMAYRCNASRYTLIIDGDYSLNVNRLLQYLRDANYPKDLLAGRVWSSSRPFRSKYDKHYMSYEFYPFRLLPPFIAAGATLMSVEIIEPMLIIAKFTKSVDFDDVFYGMVARKLGITLRDETKLLPSWWVPELADREKHRNIIGSHRLGNLKEVELIHSIIHSD